MNPRKLYPNSFTSRVLPTLLGLVLSGSLASAIPWAPRDAEGGDNDFRESPAEKLIENFPASTELPQAPQPRSVPAISQSQKHAKGDRGIVTGWTFIGPAPIPNGQTQGRVDPVSGRVTSIAIDPTDANIAYVGAAQGGLYRTLDGGATWTPLMDNATAPSVGGGNPLAIGSVTIDPTDRTRLFVGTGEGNLSGDSFFGSGFYIITAANGGSPVVSGPFNAASGSDPAGGVPAGSDIFTGRSIVAIGVDSTNANNVFVATSSGIGGIRSTINSITPRRGLYRSTNATSGSPTWTRLQVAGTSTNTICTSLVIEPGTPNNLVAVFYSQGATDPAGVYRSANALAATPTFTQSLALPNFINSKLAIQTTGGATPVVTVYATADQSSGTLYKSIDGGANFVRLTGADGFAGGQGFYDLSVGVDPNNANNVSVGGQAGNRIFRRSTDGGTTFTIDPSPPAPPAITAGLHADVHAIIYAATPADGSVIYHGNDGGIWRSADGGNNWVSRNTAGFSATQFEGIALHPIDGNFTISGSQDNGTEQQRPDGSDFRVDFGDGGYTLIDQNATDTTNVVQYHTYFNQTNNLIGSGRVLNNPCATEGEWSFHGIYGGALDTTTVYCDGTQDTFNGIALTDNVLFYAPMTLGPGNPNTWYFGTDKLYRSTDRADTTTAGSFLGDFVTDIAISPQDDNVRILGTTNNGFVFATTTGGALVQIAGPGATNGPTNTPTGPVTRVLIDPNNKNIAYVAYGGFGTPAAPRAHVFKTGNLDQLTGGGAVSFSSASSGLPDVPVDSIAIDPQSGSSSRASTDIYVGTDIGVYKSSNGGATWTQYLSGIPRVAVFGLAIQNPSRIIRAATHGRGWYDASVTASGAAAPTVLSVASRKSHGTAGTFDVNMPLAGGGVEPRRGAATTGAPGDFAIVVRFTNTLAASQAGATVTFTPGSGGTGPGGAPAGPGSGSVGSFTASGTDLTVQLTNVSDDQTGTLSISGVTDSNGMTLASTFSVPLGFLTGDTTGNKSVDIGDIGQVKSSSGSAVTAATFRRDLNLDGAINIGDIVIVKSRSGSTIP